MGQEQVIQFLLTLLSQPHSIWLLISAFLHFLRQESWHQWVLYYYHYWLVMSVRAFLLSSYFNKAIQFLSWKKSFLSVCMLKVGELNFAFMLLEAGNVPLSRGSKYQRCHPYISFLLFQKFFFFFFQKCNNAS